jgi:homoserine acetyltransferase
MRVSYTTVGQPAGEPVLMLHGTTDSAKDMLTEGFAGALYGRVKPSKYFIIIPDAIGTGGSSKPSDGLRAAFPEYNYDDMVAAQSGGPLSQAFSSRLSSFRKRQSVPAAMSWLGLDLIKPSSCRRNA